MGFVEIAVTSTLGVFAAVVSQPGENEEFKT